MLAGLETDLQVLCYRVIGLLSSMCGSGVSRWRRVSSDRTACGLPSSAFYFPGEAAQSQSTRPGRLKPPPFSSLLALPVDKPRQSRISSSWRWPVGWRCTESGYTLPRTGKAPRSTWLSPTLEFWCFRCEEHSAFPLVREVMGSPTQVHVGGQAKASGGVLQVNKKSNPSRPSAFKCSVCPSVWFLHSCLSCLENVH